MDTRLTRLAAARLILLWTRSLCARDPWETARLALEGGVDLLQVREKEATGREVYEIASRLRPWISKAGALLVVNDRLDVAMACGADGVHLGQEDLPLEDARRIAPPGLLIGISTHGLSQIERAIAGGADLVGFGPIHPTKTKPREPAIGAGELAAAARASRVPLFAIGGLDAERIAACGARRAAVSSAILSTPDPKEAARRIREALERNGGAS